MAALLEDIQTYIDFGPEDVRALADFLPLAEPRFLAIAEHFYDLILAHPNAHAAITGGDAQVERLKGTLCEWMRTGLAGPHDRDYWERRARIGRMHVKIGLPQRYMFTAMNVIRLDFRKAVEELIDDKDVAERTNNALDRLFDMELAIMLHTYQEDSEDRLRRRERLAAVGQVAASIGHDLRNPLSVIQSSLFLLQRRITDDKADRHLQKIGRQVDHCNEIVTGLLELARDRPLRRTEVDFETLAEELRDMVEKVVASQPGARVHVDIQPGISFAADATLLRQALTNLVTNALQAQGTTEVHVKFENAGPDLVVTVRDNGPGFPDDVLAVAFEPLVTTRNSGTGLGLALVARVAERHGGEAKAENLEQGALVTLYLEGE